MLAIPSVHVGEEVFSLSANTLRPRFVHSSVASSYAIRFAAGTPPFPGEAEVDIVKVSGPIERTPDEFAHATNTSAVRMIRMVFIVFDSEPLRVSGKLAAPVFRSVRLLDQLRERIRSWYYSLQTEKAYLYWARFFICWHGRNGSMRHPKDMGKPEVESFLTMLANERQVSPATHRQALNALLFLYKQVIQGFSCRMLWKPSTRGLGSRGLGIGCSRTLGLTRSSAGKPLEAKAQQGAGQDDMNNIALVFE